MSILFTGTLLTLRLIQMYKKPEKVNVEKCEIIIPQFTISKESQTTNQIFFKDASQNTTPTIEQQKNENLQLSFDDYITIETQSTIKSPSPKSLWQKYF